MKHLRSTLQNLQSLTTGRVLFSLILRNDTANGNKADKPQSRKECRDLQAKRIKEHIMRVY